MSETMKKIEKIREDSTPDYNYLIHFLRSVHEDDRLRELIYTFDTRHLTYARHFFHVREKDYLRSVYQLEKWMIQLDAIEIMVSHHDENLMNENLHGGSGDGGGGSENLIESEERAFRKQLLNRFESLLNESEKLKKRLMESESQVRIRAVDERLKQQVLSRLDPALEQLLEQVRTVRECSSQLHHMMIELDGINVESEAERHERRELIRRLSDKLSVIDATKSEVNHLLGGGNRSGNSSSSSSGNADHV